MREPEKIRRPTSRSTCKASASSPCGFAARLAALLIASVLATGCQAFDRYLHLRWLDAVDCAKANIGFGLGLAVDARVTDYFAPGLGFISYTRNYGWDDRYTFGTWEECVVIATPREVWEAVGGSEEERETEGVSLGLRLFRLATASVFLANERWLRREDGQPTVEYYSLFNFSPTSVFTRATGPKAYFLKEGEVETLRYKGFWDAGWLEVGATVGIFHGRLGVNLFQIVDFAAGLIGLDPAGDDRMLFLRGSRGSSKGSESKK